MLVCYCVGVLVWVCGVSVACVGRSPVKRCRQGGSAWLRQLLTLPRRSRFSQTSFPPQTFPPRSCSPLTLPLGVFKGLGFSSLLSSFLSSPESSWGAAVSSASESESSEYWYSISSLSLSLITVRRRWRRGRWRGEVFDERLCVYCTVWNYVSAVRYCMCSM